MRGKAVVALVALLFVSATARGSFEERDGYKASFENAVQKLLKDLEGFATWCGGSKLFLERDRAYESILIFDPDHYEAHKGLKHIQHRDGSWTVPDNLEPSKNYKPALLGKCGKKRSAVVGVFRDEVLGLFEKHADEVSLTDREAAYEAILRVDPEDKVVRGIRGEVKSGEAWVLAETSNGKKRRTKMKSALTRASKKLPKSKRVDPREDETKLGIDWRTCVDNGSVRVLSMADRKEALQITKISHLARVLFLTAFSLDDEALTKGHTIYIVPDEMSKRAFIEKHPQLRNAAPDAGEKYLGMSLGKTHDAVRWDPMPEQLLDGATRHSISVFLEQAFRIQYEHGWAFEGLGLYLTRRLTGTRATFYVDERDGKKADDKRAIDGLQKGDNWMSRSHELLTAENAPGVKRLFRLHTNEMELEDLMLSYALAAYVVEGHPDASSALLKRVSGTKNSAVAFKEVLGYDESELDARLARWLEERR